MSILMEDQQTLFIYAIGETAAIVEMGLVSIADDYSGRSMYGSTCIAVQLDEETSPEKFLLRLGAEIIALAEARERVDPSLGLNGMEIVELLMEDVQTDNLGTGTVVYFPSVHATAVTA